MRNSRTRSWRAYRPDAAPAGLAGGASGCRILGLDPGSRRTGYGILAWEAGEYVHVAHGCIDVVGLGFAARMRRIFEAHLATDPAQQEFAELVRLVASGQPLCLLCFERHADHCHRRILTERLTERLGARIVDLAP